MVKDVFVNPYSFVPLPSDVKRQPRSGHDGRATEPVYSGWIDVEWRLETPLLLPANAEAEKWIRPDGSVNLPGSSLKGAVRALHESIFNGCLRIVDEDFVPSYRDPAGKPDDEGQWRLAIVLADAGGTPTRLQMTDKSTEKWVDATALAAAWPRGRFPTNGDIVRIRGGQENHVLDRAEVRDVHHVDAKPTGDGAPFPVGQIFLPTDVSARRKYRLDRSKGRAYWVAATLTEETAVLDPANAAVQAGLNDFVIACSGSNDRRLLERDRNEPGVDTSWRERARLESVKWWTTSGTFDAVARRLSQSGLLFRGDVVWARVEGGLVTGLRLAQLWRAAGATKVGQRIGASGPCLSGRHSEADGLCLTCAIFGAADTAKGSRCRMPGTSGSVQLDPGPTSRSSRWTSRRSARPIPAAACSTCACRVTCSLARKTPSLVTGGARPTRPDPWWPGASSTGMVIQTPRPIIGLSSPADGRHRATG